MKRVNMQTNYHKQLTFKRPQWSSLCLASTQFIRAELYLLCPLLVSVCITVLLPLTD